MHAAGVLFRENVESNKTIVIRNAAGMGVGYFTVASLLRSCVGTLEQIDVHVGIDYSAGLQNS